MEDKFGIWCTRSESSAFGAGQSWLKEESKRMEYPSLEIASEVATELNKSINSLNLVYQAKRIQENTNALSDVKWRLGI